MDNITRENRYDGSHHSSTASKTSRDKIKIVSGNAHYTDERTTASRRSVCEKNSASVKGYCKTRFMCLKKVLALIVHRLIEES